MRLANIEHRGRDQVAVVLPRRGVVPLDSIDDEWACDLAALLNRGIPDLADRVSAQATAVLPESEVRFGPLLRHPRKIWGIGLNYLDHAGDLSEKLPDEPASFIKGDHTIIGPGDTIELPPQSQRVTAEAELGLIIGRTCYQVDEDEALDYVAGVCCILDQTAEDILQRNPRFLTRSKNFPTFLSLGPELVTLEEVNEVFPDLDAIEVATVKNGEKHRSNIVANMTFGPRYLISFHSQVMPLYPGDVISTGTPGAVVIEDGDLAECRIPGIGTLTNPVRRRKEASR
jgi:2-keto-4-pentenoate hydratase/2-oxohepta-3-ene-1,7-dioic acid hydratase in catechol pathway